MVATILLGALFTTPRIMSNTDIPFDSTWCLTCSQQIIPQEIVIPRTQPTAIALPTSEHHSTLLLHCSYLLTFIHSTREIAV